jgi:hypothetical protein
MWPCIEFWGTWILVRFCSEVHNNLTIIYRFCLLGWYYLSCMLRIFLLNNLVLSVLYQFLSHYYYLCVKCFCSWKTIFLGFLWVTKEFLWAVHLRKPHSHIRQGQPWPKNTAYAASLVSAVRCGWDMQAVQ